MKKNIEEVYNYFQNYLNEIREEIPYEVYSEMFEMINKLKEE